MVRTKSDVNYFIRNHSRHILLHPTWSDKWILKNRTDIILTSSDPEFGCQIPTKSSYIRYIIRHYTALSKHKIRPFRQYPIVAFDGNRLDLFRRNSVWNPVAKIPTKSKSDPTGFSRENTGFRSNPISDSIFSDRIRRLDWITWVKNKRQILKSQLPPPPSRHLYGSKSYGEYLIRTANVATANDYWNKKRTTPAKKPSCSTIITVMARHLYDYCYVYFLSIFLSCRLSLFLPFLLLLMIYK